MEIGKHCSFPDCNQLDFLPFLCKECDKYYCLKHRTCSEHQCKSIKKEKTKKIKCPICKHKFLINKNEDPNLIINNHIIKNCTGPLKKCSYKKCKEKSNLVFCKLCKKNYCIKHRFHEHL